MVNNDERRIKAGEREVVRASEEVNRRNAESAIQFANGTRKMVLEMRALFDTLQNHVINQLAQINELREQLSKLQQEIYARGTVRNSDGD